MLKAFKEKNRKSLANISQKQLYERGLNIYNLQALTQKIQSESKRSKQFIDQLVQYLQKQTIDKIAAKKLANSVGQKLMKVEQDVTNLASRLQEQRHKNQILQNLVGFYENKINSEKRDKNFESKDKKQTDQFEKQNRKLKEIQKQFEHLTLRKNRSSYEVKKKVDSVRTLRSERAVLNGVFDQLEKQIFSHQHSYKSLMIERSALMKIYQEQILELEKISDTTQKQYEKIQEKSQNDKINFIGNELDNVYGTSPSTEFNVEEESVELPSTIRNDQQSKSRRLINSRRYAMEISESMRVNAEIRKLSFKKIMARVFNELNIESISEIREKNLEQQIKSLCRQADQLYDQIYEKKQICQQEEKKDIQEVVNGQKKDNLKKSKIQTRIQNTAQQANKTHQQIEQFFNSNFHQFAQNLSQNNPTISHPQQMNVYEQYDLMKTLSEKLGQIIQSYCSNHQNQHLRKPTNDLSITESFNREQNEGKLQRILNANKTTKNTMRIYSQQELIEISQINLQQFQDFDKERDSITRKA